MSTSRAPRCLQNASLMWTEADRIKTYGKILIIKLNLSQAGDSEDNNTVLGGKGNKTTPAKEVREHADPDIFEELMVRCCCADC